jgi:hypothetical protein
VSAAWRAVVASRSFGSVSLVVAFRPDVVALIA